MSSCENKSHLHLGCHPYLTIACVISCLLCTIVMIWGTLAMRADMKHMEMLMTPKATSLQSGTVSIEDHCKIMPDITGCEDYSK